MEIPLQSELSLEGVLHNRMGNQQVFLQSFKNWLAYWEK